MVFTVGGISSHDPDMSERFSYDRAGRVRSVYFIEAGKRVEYEYTERGAIDRIVDPEGRSLEFERDELGRVTQYHGPARVSASFTYDQLSRPLTAVCGNGTSAQWNWNSAGTMDSYSWPSPAGRIFAREYGYDKLNRITERREAGYEWHYAYNPAGTLAEVRYPEDLFENIPAWQDGQFPPGHAARYQDIYSGVPASTKPGGMPPGQGNKPGSGEAWDEQPAFPDIVSNERWEYDAAANITERRRDEVSESFHYSGLNRLVQAGAVSYEYNRAGEVTEKSAPEGTAEYQWNSRGELVKAELSDGSTVSYGYDAFGRLVSRVKTPADGEVPPTAERSVYIWNRREILAEYDESAGGSLELYKQYFRAAGRLVAVKMYGFHGRREPGPEGFLHTKGGLMYYHSGRFGSPVVITDRHGEPIARYAWDAYGRAMAGVFDPYNTVGFTGKQRDGATGLTYYGARWYDADSGRFMSRDPIKDGWNWYAYVGGDPVNYVDLWGLMATESGENKTDKYEFYVGYTKIDPFNAAQHTTIVEENFETNRERVLVEGFPNRRVGTGEKSSFRWGTLERSEESRPESITTRDTLPIPEGMSSEEFKSNLEEAADSYDGSVPYEAIPELNDESGNSNSLIGSVVREAGSDFTPSRWAPGWNKEVLR